MQLWIIYRRVLKIIAGCLVIILVVVLAKTWSESCTEKVKSATEARQALARFLTSDTIAYRRLIAELRKDGMRDEFLREMQTGCRTCPVSPGTRPTEDPTSWYVFTSIASREEKKAVVLEVECESVVWLDHKLYGG
jgi:hypothetical protein